MSARAITGSALLAAVVTACLAAPASADETPAPVVVDDTISVYPYEFKTIDVLANDTSPSGQDLALCRFPDPDFSGDTLPSVFAVQDTEAGPGVVAVSVFDWKAEDATIEYYVCDHVHLTPATLTVDVKDVSPVEVTKTGRPGQLNVTNTNDAPIKFFYGSRSAKRPDGRIRVAAGATEKVRVDRHNIVWIATIGQGGIADHGRVRNITLPGGARLSPAEGSMEPWPSGYRLIHGRDRVVRLR